MMKEERSAAGRVYLQLFGFYSLLTFILWPEPSYYGVLRYGTMPTLFTSLPYLLIIGALPAALYLGLSESGARGARLLGVTAEQAMAVTVMTLPPATLALGVARVSFSRLPLLAAVLLPSILLYFSLGLLVGRLVRMPVGRQAIGWGAGAVLLATTGFYLPAANPVVATATVVGSSSASFLLGGFDRFPWAVALLLPLLGSGILLAVVVRWKLCRGRCWSSSPPSPGAEEWSAS